MADLIAAASEAAKSAGLLSDQTASSETLEGVELNRALRCLPSVEDVNFARKAFFQSDSDSQTSLKGSLLQWLSGKEHFMGLGHCRESKLLQGFKKQFRCVIHEHPKWSPTLSTSL